METRIIKPSELLSEEDAVNVKGGVSKQVNDTAQECSCDCWIGNSNNTQPEKPKPTQPSTPAKGN